MLQINRPLSQKSVIAVRIKRMEIVVQLVDTLIGVVWWKVMGNKELYEAFYNQTTYFRFGDFLESLYEKCDFCEEPCGNDWCPAIEEEE